MRICAWCCNKAVYNGTQIGHHLADESSLLEISMLKILTSLFPVWAILGSVTAYVQPELFVPHKDLIVPLLMIIMLAMGLTLSVTDFMRLSSSFKAAGVGVLLQFSIMPAAPF